MTATKTKPIVERDPEADRLRARDFTKRTIASLAIELETLAIKRELATSIENRKAELAGEHAELVARLKLESEAVQKAMADEIASGKPVDPAARKRLVELESDILAATEKHRRDVDAQNGLLNDLQGDLIRYAHIGAEITITTNKLAGLECARPEWHDEWFGLDALLRAIAPLEKQISDIAETHQSLLNEARRKGQETDQHARNVRQWKSARGKFYAARGEWSARRDELREQMISE